MIGVFAGNYAQYRAWVYEHGGINPRRFCYLSTEEDIREKVFSKIIEIGTYYDNPDYYELRELAQTKLKRKA